MKTKLLITAMALSIAIVGFTNSSAAPKKAPKAKKGQLADTVKKATAAKGSIEAVLKPTTPRKDGLITFAVQDDKYYMLVPTAKLDKDMLMVTRISKAPVDFRTGFIGYAGDQVGESVIRFNLSPDKKNLFVENISTREIPRDSLGDMYQNVMKSNIQPLVYSFEVKGTNKAKDTLLIDATDFFGGDNSLIGFDPFFKMFLNIGGFQKDKSYVLDAKSFPINSEVKSIKTYMFTPNGTFNGKPLPAAPMTFEFNNSIVALPQVPMQARYYDPRVGYFTERYIDFDKNPQGVKNMELITRWRLEPKPEDVEKYKAGELVEPAEQIVYYIDPTTPKKWVPYLIAGVNDWEPVFRKAGFKNAIVGKEAPVGDSTWSLDDARHSAIVYKPSTIPNASGPHVHDPRTGQILESHINWYHNVMLLLRNWYMLQAGPNDVRARQLVFPDSLMGDLIRFVSSHEVGHTLGLRHNFGSTSKTPVDSLRSASFLKKYGHTPSIMDYSRFNYVVQPEDGIAPELQYPRINDYDEWAIEWGYRRFPDLTTPDAEKTKMNEWIIEKQKNPRLWFGQESNPSDPRSQSEDLGDNQMKANALGIKNLKRVVAGLPSWTKEANGDYDKLEQIYGEVLSQYIRYVRHVEKWVGGWYENPRTQEQGADVNLPVEKAKQQEAMVWLAEHFFKAPTWLFSQEVFTPTGLSADRIGATISGNIRALVSSRVLRNLLAAEAKDGAKAYTVTNLFNDLNANILVAAPNQYQRTMQKNYAKALIDLMPQKDMTINSTYAMGDALSVVYAQLRNLQNRFATTSTSDAVTAAHYKYLVQQIKDALDNK